MQADSLREVTDDVLTNFAEQLDFTMSAVVTAKHSKHLLEVITEFIKKVTNLYPKCGFYQFSFQVGNEIVLDLSTKQSEGYELENLSENESM